MPMRAAKEPSEYVRWRFYHPRQHPFQAFVFGAHQSKEKHRVHDCPCAPSMWEDPKRSLWHVRTHVAASA